MNRERDRYGRETLSERLGNVIGWFRAHPLALVPLAIFLGGIVIQSVAPQRSARPNDLAIGDCLFVRTSAAGVIGANARPIGELKEVAEVLMRGAAERASCSASHGHEVSGIVPVDRQPDDAEFGVALALAMQCDSAFVGYVGHPEVDSVYQSLVVMPTDEAWAAGVHRVICLVARKDGQWMREPARNSRG